MRALGITSPIVGIALGVWGFVRLNSISSQFWRAVGYADNTAYGAIAVGVVAAIVGLGVLFKSGRVQS